MNTFQRSMQFASDWARAGLLYAIANYRVHSPAPLDPIENWQFWTNPRPEWAVNLSKNSPSAAKRKAYLENMLTRDHASGIEEHYDVSNEFYALFLDTQYRFYTCAEFQNDQETLEDAQTRKAEYLRSLLKLNGNEKILDLGCGWGAMLKYLQETGHKDELAGFTLSKEQLAYGKETLGFDISLSNFITEPFHDAPYDRIFSIGAIEHVRPIELKGLYQKIYDALAPGGLSVHQFFSFEHEAYPASAIMLQLFFPGSLLVIHRHHLEAAKSAGFKVTHDSVHDYRPTIKAWYDRLAEKREEAIALSGLEVYNRYMTFFPSAWMFFQQDEAKLHRIVMEK
ncbi:MAG: class I SAM-dependent methyltransferase [Cyanobacteria bacterium P01_C01_bin.69]